MRSIYTLASICFIAISPHTSQTHAVSTTMQVSMNVIPDCSISVDFDKDRDRHAQHDIRCGGDSSHRIYYHRRNQREEAHAYTSSDSWRSRDVHHKRDRDNDHVVWLTTEF